MPGHNRERFSFFILDELTQNWPTNVEVKSPDSFLIFPFNFPLTRNFFKAVAFVYADVGFESPLISNSTLEMEMEQTFDEIIRNRFSSPNRVETDNRRRTIKRGLARKAELEPDIRYTLSEKDKYQSDFYTLTDLFKIEVVQDDPLPPPYEIAGLREEVRKFRWAEIGAYGASLILLGFINYLTLALEWWQIGIVMAFFFVVVYLVLPVVNVFFNVDQENPESIKKVKKAAGIAAIAGVSMLLIFTFLRFSGATDGVEGFLSNYSLPAAEICFALLGAFCGEIKNFYNWSRLIEKRYQELDKKQSALEIELREIEEKIELASAGTESIQEVTDSSN